MKYPTRNDYDTAVRNLDKLVFDNIVKHGKPIMQTQNPRFLRSYNGGKATVYEIETKSGKYALKCWVEDLGSLKNRYKEIDEYLKKIKSPYFVDFSYNEQGILVNGQKFPIIRMEWIDGISFKEFISNNINNPHNIRDFADKFLDMMKSLHQNNISHGDLQHGNIMVRKNGDICLIDYDSLYVPQLSNEDDRIKGLEGYQHPNRNRLVKLSSKSDYFSELVIYLSLLAISENTSYWKRIEQEERLLFSKKDLVNLSSSSIFSELTKYSPEVVYYTLELEKFCKQPDIESLQPLENLVNAFKGSKISWDFPPNPQTNSSPPSAVSVDLNYPAWNTFAKAPPNPSPQKVSTSDPWDKLDTNTSSAWDKLDRVESPKNNAWDSLPQPVPIDSTKPVTDENGWDKFDKIRDKALKSTPIIWDKFNKIWDKVLKSAPLIWDKFNKIRDKALKSAPLIWDKFKNWFN